MLLQYSRDTPICNSFIHFRLEGNTIFVALVQAYFGIAIHIIPCKQLVFMQIAYCQLLT